MSKAIEQWFPGQVKPIKYKRNMFELDVEPYSKSWIVDFGDGRKEPLDIEGYNVTFADIKKEDGGGPEGYLTDNSILYRVLEDIEKALQEKRIKQYAISAFELYPHEEGNVPFGLLISRIRSLYTLYLCYRIIIWSELDEKRGVEITQETLRRAWPLFDQSAEMAHILQRITGEVPKHPDGYYSMSIREAAFYIVQDIAQSFLSKNISIEYYVGKIPTTDTYINSRGEKATREVYKEQLIDRYVCDSLYTALLMQLMQYVQLGDKVKGKRTLKQCEQCGADFLAQRSDARFCPICGNEANRQARSTKRKKEAKQNAPQINP